MHKSKRYWLATVLPIPFCLLSFCSGLFDDSTDLGAAIIENIDSNKVTINKHIREYVLDTSSAFISDSSFPGPSDTGFGVHAATNSFMVIGTKSDSLGTERAAGWVRFTCPPDTGTSKTFAANDTLRAIIIRFTRGDSVANHPDPRRVTVWSSQVRSDALNPSAATGDTLLDTMDFSKDTSVSIPDSIVLAPGRSLARTIFKACTTRTTDTLLPVIGFILSTLNTTDTIIRLNGNPILYVKYTRGSDTNIRYQQYGSVNTSYYLATDGDSASLQKTPVLSYASQRTAVFHYTIAAFWDTINNMVNSQHAQVLSAVFSLKGPKAGDTLNIRYLVYPDPVHNGTELDSLFNTNPSSPGMVTIADTARVQVNVRQSLEWYIKNGRPSALYLYLRLAEDTKQIWKKTVWNSKPVLTAMIAVP